MGLDIYLENGTKHTSERYPEHLCNPSYLRSSYNNAGFNSVAKQLVDMDLYDVFRPEDWPQIETGADEDGEMNYDQIPTTTQLIEARQQALVLVAKLEVAPPLRVTTVSYKNLFADEGPIVTDHEALALAVSELMPTEEKEGHVPSHFRSYSMGGNEFWTEGLAVVAAIPGFDHFNAPAVHLIYLSDEADTEYYTQFAEIVVEFIHHALELPDDRRHITWSA